MGVPSMSASDMIFAAFIFVGLPCIAVTGVIAALLWWWLG